MAVVLRFREVDRARFEAMLAEVPLKKVMPALDTIEEVRERYASYSGYSEKIQQFGIIGFELENNEAVNLL